MKTQDGSDIIGIDETSFITSSNDKIFYDGIIINPPYIRHEKIDQLKSLGISKTILRKNRIFKNLPTNANIYISLLIKYFYQKMSIYSTQST